MDLQDQLRQLFPDHIPKDTGDPEKEDKPLWIQEEPIICKYEKRKGKPVTILEGYTGRSEDFRALTSEIKKALSVGGSFKDDRIIIQGDYRDKIMNILRDKGFRVKRVGG